MSGFTFERQPEYCELKFTPELSQMAWADVEAATKRVTELVHDDHTNSVLVDLSELTSMPSGIVASLVRTWKGMDERKRKLVVVSTADKVTQELEQTGLASLWTLTDDRSQAYRVLGVQPQEDDDQTITSGNTAFAEASQPVTNEPYGFKEARAFCGIQMNPILMTISWEEMEQATTDVISQYKASKIKNLLVDVSRMEMINSGLVAALVRVWKATKERNGKFSLVSPNDMVTGVLKSAGLWKLWNVVDDRDEAVYSMGVSSVVTVGSTDSTTPHAIPVETPIAASCAVLAAVGTGVMCFSKNPRNIENAQLFGLLFAGGAVATGALALFRDTGKRKLLACVALIVGLGVMGMYISGTRAGIVPGLDSAADSSDPDADSAGTDDDSGDGRENDKSNGE